MASGDDSPAGWLLQGTVAGFGLSEIIKSGHIQINRVDRSWFL